MHIMCGCEHVSRVYVLCLSEMGIGLLRASEEAWDICPPRLTTHRYKEFPVVPPPPLLPADRSYPHPEPPPRTPTALRRPDASRSSVEAPRTQPLGPPPQFLSTCFLLCFYSIFVSSFLASASPFPSSLLFLDFLLFASCPVFCYLSVSVTHPPPLS